MSVIQNIKAALAHLEMIAGEIETGIEHDVERLAGDVRDFLHLGYANITSRRGEAPAAPAAAPVAEAAPVAAEQKFVAVEANTLDGPRTVLAAVVDPVAPAGAAEVPVVADQAAVAAADTAATEAK